MARIIAMSIDLSFHVGSSKSLEGCFGSILWFKIEMLGFFFLPSCVKVLDKCTEGIKG